MFGILVNCIQQTTGDRLSNAEVAVEQCVNFLDSVDAMKLVRVVKLVFDFLGNSLYACLYDNQSLIAMRLRQLRFHTTCYIDSAVVIVNKENFDCGSGCALYHGTYILNHKGRFTLGDDSHLGHVLRERLLWQSSDWEQCSCRSTYHVYGLFQS